MPQDITQAVEASNEDTQTVPATAEPAVRPLRAQDVPALLSNRIA
jgi:hypothetical protein